MRTASAAWAAAFFLARVDGVQMDYMKARDYLQMAGRAGRQGLDKSGLVISILEDEDLLEAPLSRYHSGKVEPITSRFNLSYSTILNLYDRLGSKGLLAAYDKSFAAFQALKGTPSAGSATTTPACCRSTRKWSSGCSRPAC